MVLFPATLYLAIFFVPASPAILVSAVMTLLAILGAWVWGWGMVSTAGAGSGIAAGFVVGLGVRSRPVGGWGYAALVGLWASSQSVPFCNHAPCTGPYVQLPPVANPVVLRRFPSF